MHRFSLIKVGVRFFLARGWCMIFSLIGVGAWISLIEVASLWHGLFCHSVWYMHGSFFLEVGYMWFLL